MPLSAGRCFMNHIVLCWHISAMSHSVWGLKHIMNSTGNRSQLFTCRVGKSVHSICFKPHKLNYRYCVYTEGYVLCMYVLHTHGNLKWASMFNSGCVWESSISIYHVNECIDLTDHRTPTPGSLHSSLYWTPHCVSGSSCWPNFQHNCEERQRKLVAVLFKLSFSPVNPATSWSLDWTDIVSGVYFKAHHFVRRRLLRGFHF